MKFLTNLPQTEPPAFYRSGVFFADREPVTVRRWIVKWSEAVTGFEYALAGPFDFIAELSCALRKLEPEDVAGVWLWPCTADTPSTVYRLAAGTLGRMKGSDSGVYRKWDQRLEGVDYTVPHWLELRAYSENSKRKVVENADS